MTQEALISPIREWLVDQSLGDNDIVTMFETLCMRMVGVGIPVTRARLMWPTLHPLFRAETVSWDYGSKAVLEQFLHQENESDDWKNSPLKFIVDNDIEIFRRQLTGPNELIDFEMLEDLKQRGFTDYLVHSTKLEGYTSKTGGMGNSQGIIVTWASDRPGGFSPADLGSLNKIQRRFAVACKTVMQSRISRNIASTYLGQRAGGSVLEGNIRRGDGETMSAVVWYSDMRNSTSLAESMPAEDYFKMLNSFFEATAESVVSNGGEILDFIGDAVLGIFPYTKTNELKQAAILANRALDQTVELANAANAEREAEGAERFKFGIGLNVGDVMFGNIGIPSRLSFSVIGPTVNEVARIENMTKLLQHPVLASGKFASLDPDRWKSVGEHKLDGVAEPLELYAFQCSVAA